jgi:hypothetical protein
VGACCGPPGTPSMPPQIRSLISDADWLDAGDVTNASIMTANADRPQPLPRLRVLLPKYLPPPPSH